MADIFSVFQRFHYILYMIGWAKLITNENGFRRLGESELATVPTYCGKSDFAVVYKLALLTLQCQKGLILSAWK